MSYPLNFNKMGRKKSSIAAANKAAAKAKAAADAALAAMSPADRMEAEVEKLHKIASQSGSKADWERVGYYQTRLNQLRRDEYSAAARQNPKDISAEAEDANWGNVEDWQL